MVTHNQLSACLAEFRLIILRTWSLGH
jgi:hypothetical protein